MTDELRALLVDQIQHGVLDAEHRALRSVSADSAPTTWPSA